MRNTLNQFNNDDVNDDDVNDDDVNDDDVKIKRSLTDKYYIYY